jgi:hypothetical protein
VAWLGRFAGDNEAQVVWNAGRHKRQLGMSMYLCTNEGDTLYHSVFDNTYLRHHDNEHEDGSISGISTGGVLRTSH